MPSPSGGGGGGSQQTVTQTQQIPEFEQQFAQENQDLARSLSSQPYPVYQGPLVAGFTPTQQAGQQAALDTSTAYQPGLNAGMATTTNALNQNPLNAMLPQLGTSANMIAGAGQQGAGAVNAGAGLIGAAANVNPLAGNPANPGVIGSYMSPYISQALQPQIDALQTQLGQQRNQIGAGATQAGAFGDARQGVAEALNNKYGDQQLAGIVGNGYNTAFQNALSTAQQQEQLGLGEQQFGASAGQALANLGQGQQQLGLSQGQALGSLGLSTVAAGQQGQNIQFAGGQQLANMGAMNQQLGQNAANMIYNVGAQQQGLQQSDLNTAFQQYQNQVNWPYQGLNTRLSALSNSPYSISNAITVPGANQTAQNLGTFSSLAGALGSLTGGSAAPFGGAPYSAAQAHA